VTAKEGPFELVLTPAAVRAPQSRLPEPVASAVIEFLTGSLVANPRRVGKPLRGDLAGVHSARRGTYRVRYRVNDTRREVVVVRIDPRRGGYRTD
jgi:mRNA-degrading endonuclease RelE of RelBE toxin-antitoxin system